MLPIVFPENITEYSPRSHLLSLSFSPTSPTCLFIDEVLTSQTEAIFPFTEGGNVLVLGSSLTSSSSSSSLSSSGMKEILTKDDVMEETGVLISSVNILQGNVNESDLSHQ